MVGALVLVVGLVIAGALGGALLGDEAADAEQAQQSFTATSIAPPRLATDSEIQYIRQAYRSIESGTNTLPAVPLKLGRFAGREWPAADSVSASAYGDPRATGKVRLRILEGPMRTSLLFYYDAGTLVFVHEIKGIVGSGADAEQRFYFRDRALIRWRDETNQIVPLGTVYSDATRRLLGISDSLLEATART